DQPVLLFMLWSPEGGTFITPYKSDIEEVMNGLCPNSTNHYALQEFNLSAFSPIIIEEDPQ
ncbi:MAG: hypothetical protein J6Y80_02185, partial [Victivallales bacterium]|nr:hypothetical protein [Victivallales bacterium]